MVNIDRKFIGRVLSMVSISFAKRLTTRPMGVVSKNDIGPRRIRVSMPECMILLADRVPSDIVIEPIRMNKATTDNQKY